MQTNIDALVARVPQWDGLRPAVRPVRNAADNELFVVTVDDHEYVVHLPARSVSMLGILPANEAEAARRAADVGVGPAVLGELPEVHTLITELVPGRRIDPDRVAARLSDVVDIIHRLHDSGPLVGSFPVHRVVEWHARDAGAHGVIAPGAYERLHQQSRRIETAFAKAPMPPVPSHNNLLAANLLFDERRVWLLDFKYAGMNDVYFDLADLSMNCGFDAATDEEMVSLYFGHVGHTSLARLRLMKVMAEFRQGMRAVVQRAIGAADPDLVGDPEERLRACERHASGPEFEKWLLEAGRSDI
jgi:hypothetical protein